MWEVFVSDLATLMTTLNDMMKKERYECTDKQENVFVRIKDKVADCRTQ
mgnify:CR=1 FL=1